MHHDELHDGSVDLLITGCEGSLWVGEQFASDMHNAFPQLKIVCLSANKAREFAEMEDYSRRRITNESFIMANPRAPLGTISARSRHDLGTAHPRAVARAARPGLPCAEHWVLLQRVLVQAQQHARRDRAEISARDRAEIPT